MIRQHHVLEPERSEGIYVVHRGYLNVGSLVTYFRAETPPEGEHLAGARGPFHLGTSLSLYLRWFEEVDELGVSDVERSADLAIVEQDDVFADLALPFVIGACTLDLADPFG